MKTINKVLETITGFLRDSFCLADHIIDYLTAKKIRNLEGIAFGVLCYINPCNLSKPDFMDNIRAQQERERRIKEQEEKERKEVTIHEEDCLSTNDFKNLDSGFREEIERMLQERILTRKQIKIISKNSGIILRNIKVDEDFFGRTPRRKWSIVYVIKKCSIAKNSKTNLFFKACKEFISLSVDDNFKIEEAVKISGKTFKVQIKNENISQVKEFLVTLSN